MNVLIVGGTRFVGRHIAHALSEYGDRVTLFHRGNTPLPEDLRGAEEVLGDREQGLSALGERAFDAVVDTCGYTPGAVERAAAALKERTHRYLFISSISVYDVSRVRTPVEEDAPLAQLPPGADREVMTTETYGALKALCEETVRTVFGERATIVRPGLVAGPYDSTDRFTYWPVRIAAGGEVLCPVSPQEPVQYIDGRDLAHFARELLRRDTGGTFNAVTPPAALRIGDVLADAVEASGSDARLRWADRAFLAEHDVEPWSDMPLWIPKGDPSSAFTEVSDARGRAAGLRCRPASETVRDTLHWAVEAGKRLGTLQAGLSPDRERDLVGLLR